MKSFQIQRQSAVDFVFRRVIEFADQPSAIDWLTAYLSRNSDHAPRFRIVESISTVLINGPDLVPRFTPNQLAEFIKQFPNVESVFAPDCEANRSLNRRILRCPRMSLESLADIVGKIARHFDLPDSGKWQIKSSHMGSKFLVELPEFEPDWNSVGTSTN